MMDSRLKNKEQTNRAQIFHHIPFAENRREIIRWVINDHLSVNENTIALLRMGLADPDWEVRMSSILACVRLSFSQLVPEIRKVEIPSVSRSGLNTEEQSIMLSIKKAALFLLCGGEAQTFPDKMPETPEEAKQYLISCVAGQKMTRYHDLFLLIVALVSPLYPAPKPDLPEAIDEKQGNYFLKYSNIQLCWVPGFTHFLGSSNISHHPIQFAKVEKGFFISKHPIDIDSKTEENQPVFKCTFQEAFQFCNELSKEEGIKISIPNSLVWEMGARGHNGRLYPWGLSYSKDMLELESPWGLRRTVGFGGEWTTSVTKNNYHIVMGASKQLRCYDMNFAASTEQYAFRIFVPI